MARAFGKFYKTLRHALIRLWERRFDRVETAKGPACDFWLVCHSKDWQSAVLTIESIRRYSLNPVRTIFLIGNEADRPSWVPNGVSYIYEGELPVTEMVLDLLKGTTYKGWILQQILKLSGVDYSDLFVTIDCDTVLLKPHLFYTEKETVLRIAYEHSPQYRKLEKLLNINASRLLSFTCHMMPYKAELVRALIAKIEYQTGKNWVVYICGFAKRHGMSAAVDYDLYARHILTSKEKVLFRPWLNKTVEPAMLDNIENLKISYPGRNSLSFHQSGDRGPHEVKF